MPAPKTRRVLMLAFENAQILDITGPLEILASANEWEPRTVRYEIVIAAEKSGPFATSSGMKLVADCGFSDLSPADIAGVHTFMVSGGDGTLAALGNPRLVAFAKRAAVAAPRVATVCSGAAILAATGLLDGRRATTHWNAADAIARAFPKVRLEPDAIYVRDGKFWTSAGITAGMDLALALIEADLGREAALSIARRHVLYLMRPGGQAQFSAELAAQAQPQGRTARAVDYIVKNLARDLSLGALARAAGLSERSLQRAFASEMGMTPAAFVTRARLDMARRRLSSGAINVSRVAAECGFPSAEIMRRAFQRELGISPADYRARFATTERRAP